MKMLVLALALFLYSASYSQITVTKAVEIPVRKYDSTVNFLGNNVGQYIGQELYLKGLPENLQEYGYSNFVIDYRKDEMETGNRYKDGSITGSKYTELVGKYFIVLDTIKNHNIFCDYFLKLQEKASRDTLYFLYHVDHKSDFPFTVTGYFEKMKQMLSGKKYVIRGLTGDHQKEITTGQPVADFTVGKVWTIADITIDESNYEVSAVVENAKHEKTLWRLDLLTSDYWLEYDKMIKAGMKPGDENWQLAANFEVKKGMTKAMCELSLGTPDNITKKTESGKKLESWTYKREMLFFDNGILYSIK
jgi:hypothetical protein